MFVSHGNVYSIRLAIIPVRNSVHRGDNVYSIMGENKLREKHLKTMGYHVLTLCYNDWNSMYMALPGAKVEYLREKLSLS